MVVSRSGESNNYKPQREEMMGRTTLQANAWSKNPLLDSSYQTQTPKHQIKLEAAQLEYPTANRIYDGSYAESEVNREAFNRVREPDPNHAKNGPIYMQMSLSKTLFVSGLQELTGNVVLICKSGSKVKIGKIHVCVEGIEEILEDKGKRSTIRRFYNHSVVLQSHETVPSDAVAANTPDEHGMFQALKRTTQLSFRIPTRSSNALPPSYWSEKIGGIRWVVTAYAEIKIRHKKVPALCISREILVIDHQNIDKPPATSPPYTSATSSRVISKWLNGEGPIRIDATLFHNENSNNAWIAGSVGFISLSIKNSSPVSVGKVVVGLYRRFKTFEFTNALDQVLRPRSFSRVLVEGSSVELGRRRKGNWWAEGARAKRERGWEAVGAGCLSECMIDVPVPEGLRSVATGVLIDVSFVVKISVFPDKGDSIDVEIPVEIRHPISVMKELPKLTTEDSYRLFEDRQVFLEPEEEIVESNSNRDCTVENDHDAEVLPEPTNEEASSSLAAAAEVNDFQRDYYQQLSRPQTPLAQAIESFRPPSVMEVRLPVTPDYRAEKRVSRTPSIDYGSSPASRISRNSPHQPTREYIPFTLGPGTSPNRTQSVQNWPILAQPALSESENICDDWQNKLAWGGSLRSNRLSKRRSIPIPQALAPVLSQPAIVLKRNKTITREQSIRIAAPVFEKNDEQDFSAGNGRRSGFEIDRMIQQVTNEPSTQVVASEIDNDGHTSDLKMRESFHEMDEMLAAMRD